MFTVIILLLVSKVHRMLLRLGHVDVLRRPPISMLTRPQLVVPKHHGTKLTDIPDDQLMDILPVVKKIATATGAENYNVLQNNGRPAHQEVDHVSLCLKSRIQLDLARVEDSFCKQVHFHLIPKPSPSEGLGIGWPAQPTDMDKLKQLFTDLKAKM